MTDLDRTRPYRVVGQPAIAWRTLGYAQRCDPGTGEDEPDYDLAVMVMIGDDRRYEFPVADLVALGELDFCAGCGQIGCTADARDRPEAPR